MYLKKIYLDPIGLFEPVIFKNGVNFIFGKKDKKSDSKKSLNGIGKSTFLDLIDFCLLSEYGNKNNRLKSAGKILLNHSAILEFEIDNKDYFIKRSFGNPNKDIEFGEVGGETSLFTLSDLKIKICDLTFGRDDYKGKYNAGWYRSLISFFLKIQKPKSEKFLDPIAYIPQKSLSLLNIFHLFLLNIDNTLLVKNFDIQDNLKKKEPAIRELKKLVEETFDIKNIEDSKERVEKTKRDIDLLDKNIQKFQLAGQYKGAEEEANLLTEKIKNLWSANYIDRQKISSYKESFSVKDDLDSGEIRKIESIYKEFSELLATNIKKTLTQAVDFRKKIASSHKKFIIEEINKIEKDIISRSTEISEAEEVRSRLFEFLSAKEAIKDLTEAFYSLSEKKKVLSDLEAQINTYDKLDYERIELEIEEKKLEKQIKSFVNDIQSAVAKISLTFSEIYNSIYVQSKDPLFTINEYLKSDAKIEIKTVFPAMFSKGKNQGRTLVYDLMILFNAINENMNFPRFLIHDGIFDGMDKAHFVYLYNYLENKKNNVKFQYIITLNEEGTLNENFGPADSVNPDKIENEAILCLTPSKKLIGEFD